METIFDTEECIRCYLLGVASLWHQGEIPNERIIKARVDAMIGEVDCTPVQEWLQYRLEGLLGEVLTFSRLNG